MAQDVELVVHDLGVGHMLLEAEPEGLPHVHAHSPDGPPPRRGQGLREELVQGLALTLQPHPQRLPALQVAHHREELDGLAQKDLVHPEVVQRRAGPGRRPAPQRPLVHPPDRLGREAPLDGHAAHRRGLTVLGHHRLQPGCVVGLAVHEGQPFGPYATAATADAMDLDVQPHRPGPPGQIPDPSLRPAVDLAHRDPTAPTDVVGLPGGLPDPQGQRVGRFVGLRGIDPIARQAQNACYDLFGHRLPPVRDSESRQEI